MQSSANITIFLSNVAYSGPENSRNYHVRNTPPILFCFRYDTDKVRKRLPYLFVIIWLIGSAAQMHLIVSTALIGDRCIAAYHLLTSFFVDYQAPFAIVVSFGIPFVIIMFCYIRMFLVLNDSKKNFNLGGGGESVHKLRLAQINIFKTCVVLVSIYLVAWIVTQTALFMFLIGIYDVLTNTHSSIGDVLVTFNSFVNPFIYAMNYNDFKKRIREIYSRGRRQIEEKITS